MRGLRELLRRGFDACATALVLIAATPAAGQAMREVRALPADCRVNLPPADRGRMQSWQSFIWVEHCDRIKRLQRLSAMLPLDQQPQFFEGVIPAARLPTDFRTDMPVLRVVFPDRTFFDTAAAALRPEADQVTAIVAESLRHEPPDVSMFVAGHADARGERGLNERLSIDRANSIAGHIMEAGVNQSSIWRVGFGEDMPLVSGANAYAWDRNRRVEFLFASRPEAVATWLADQQLDNLCQAQTSTEAERCKAALTFDHNYAAVELKPRARVAISPATPALRGLKPAVAAAQGVKPRSGPSHGVAPEGAELVGVDPAGGRRIGINPRSRRPEAVGVRL